MQEVITMMDSITVGAKIKMTEAVTGDYPVGSTATIIYIDDMDNVFIEWSDGKLSSFSDKQVIHGFEKITPKYSAPIQEHIERISYFEDIMDRIQAMDSTSPERRKLLGELSAYYSSDAWKRDFAADEAGLLPKDLKRGVLSEDGIYNLLEESSTD